MLPDTNLAYLPRSSAMPALDAVLPAQRLTPVLQTVTPAVAVENIHFSYGAKPVLHGISLSVPAGSVCGVFGPNGSGKTTLFRCCLGFLRPQQGTIRVDGEDIASLGIAALARRIAYVPQEHKPGFPFTVREIVSMGRTPHMGGFFRLRAKDTVVVEQAMAITGVSDLADEPYMALSGGQRQLTSLARAFAQEAPLMLLDEPTSALDFSNQMIVWQALRRIAGQGVTVLVCCHDPNHILWFCDEVAVLRQGCIAAAGKSAETLTGDVLRSLYGTDIEVCLVDGRPLARPAGGK
jgi:ABC-type cobalamin/Fe3+-siderophores transport systems, ATPase components